MLLTKHNLIHYLLDKGLANTELLINGEFTVRNSDSRNVNFIVNKEHDHHNYFIKQIKATEQEKIETLATEAACYILAQQTTAKSLTTFFPKFYHYDKHNHILITEQVKNVINLHEYYFSNFNFTDIGVVQKIAQILATLHNSSTLQAVNNVDATHKIVFKNGTPWVFTLTARPLQFWLQQPVSAEQQAMVLLLKNTAFCNLINEVPKLWSANALLHNDIKFTNFIGEVTEANNITNIKLVDWELADYGDSIWDVACLVQNFIQLWATTDLPDKELALQPNLKRIPLVTIQQCINTFWYSYAKNAAIPTAEHFPLLLKLTKFVALKLVHTCFETTPYSQSLQPTSVKLLQIAHNILKSPENAITHLLGIK